MENAVEDLGAQAEEGEEWQRLTKAFSCQVRFLTEDNDKSDKDQHQMPDDAVKCQRPVRMEDTGRVDKGSDSAHHIEIKQKGTEHPVPFFVMYQDEQRTQIHRQTAELEWKNPPVVGVIIDDIKIHKLFVKFSKQQNQTGNQHDAVELWRISGSRDFPGNPNGDGTAAKSSNQVKRSI